MAPKKAETKLQLFKVHQAREERRKVLEPAILGVVSALGGFEDVLIESDDEERDDIQNSRSRSKLKKVYKLGDECLGCLKDLKKFWRLDEDDDDRTVARVLHDSRILPNDLLPIITSIDPSDKKGVRVALLCSDLISALTWPIDVASELREMNELLDQENKRRLNRIDYSGLISAQQSYKREILRSGALAHIFRLIVPSLQKGKRERTEKDENIISLILHIIRNLVALRDKPPPIGESSMCSEDYQLQSGLILQMSEIDIWHLLFRGIVPEDLVDSDAFSKTNEHGQTISTLSTSARKLDSLLAEEKREKRLRDRQAPTRHSRFGTTISIHTGDRKYNLHSQSDINRSVEVAIDAHKKERNKPARLKDEFGPSTELTVDAMKVLRKVAIEFVESAFNPFFGSILQDIQMERDKVKETDTIRFMSLFGFFLQYFLLLRDREKHVGILPDSEEGHDFDLIASLIEPTCIRYTLNRIKVNLEAKPMPAVEVHAAVHCLIHQLLVIDGLIASGVAAHIEAANIIQDKLYYDETSLEVVIQLLCCFTTQSVKFLENIVYLANVFLRMLERYSKKQDYMFVRKKVPVKKSRAKDKGKSKEGEDENAEAGLGVADEEEAEFEAMDAQRAETYADHKFEFEKFQLRFAREPVLNTLMIYLAGHRDFSDPEQVKRVVRLLHRIAVNAKADNLFFKVSILDTLNTILDDRASLPRNSAYSDLFKLIEYVLKQFFKAVRQDPFLLVESFFPSRKTKAGGRTTGVNSDSDADSLVLTKSKKKGVMKLPAEIVIKPGLTWSQRMGVAVGLLVDNDKSHFIENVKDILRTVSATRTAIVLIEDGIPGGDHDVNFQAWLDEPNEEIGDELKSQLAQASQAALEKFEDHAVKSDDEDFQKGLRRDPQLHMLLRLLKWSSVEEEIGHLEWTIPKARLHTELDVDIRILDHFLVNPLDHNGKSAAELVKKKRKAPVRRTRRARETSADLNDDERALDDESGIEDTRETRKAKKQQEIKQYQSAQFIADSDDEENPERDAIFFERERALREQINKGALLGMGAPGVDAKAVSTRKARPKQKPRARRAPKLASLKENLNPSSSALTNSHDVSDVEMLELDGDVTKAVNEGPDGQPRSPVAASNDEGTNSIDESDKGPLTTVTSITTPTRSSTSASPTDSNSDRSVEVASKKRAFGSSNPLVVEDSEDEVDELEESPRKVKSRRLCVLESDGE